ncbi:MAG: SDR family oxidoreductase [Limnohabitans sp.]|nr:SDR family oxidoreductase [Limnohabitans sp.]
MKDIIIVTGASRGIGAATARKLGSKGASVVINYQDSEKEAQAVLKDVVDAGGQGLCVQGDVGNENDVLRLFELTQNHFGSPTGLVNNAGIIGTSKRRIEELKVDTMTEVMRINVIGTLLCSREAVLRMSERHGGKGGCIVNVSSLGALTGSPFAFVDYGASKGAVDTLTVGMAAELAKYGVRVNGVRPGMIDTDIHASAGMADRVEKHGPQMPMGRAGLAEEVADVIVFLLSKESSYVTGAMVDVAGGAR